MCQKYSFVSKNVKWGAGNGKHIQIFNAFLEQFSRLASGFIVYYLRDETWRNATARHRFPSYEAMTRRKLKPCRTNNFEAYYSTYKTVHTRNSHTQNNISPLNICGENSKENI